MASAFLTTGRPRTFKAMQRTTGGLGVYVIARSRHKTAPLT